MFGLLKSVIKDGVLSSSMPSGDLPRLDKPLVELLLDLVDKRIQEEGDGDVVIHAELALQGKQSDHISKQSLRLSDIQAYTRKAAKVLHHLGLCPGDIVQISLPNTTAYFYPVYATWLCQGTVSTVDPSLKDELCRQPLEDTKPKIVFCCEGNKDTLVAALKIVGLKSTKIILMDFDVEEDRQRNIFGFYTLVKESDGFADLPTIESFDPYNDTSALIWSSGTTARSKAVKKSMMSLAVYTISLGLNLGTMLSSSQFFHVSGFIMGIQHIFHKTFVYFLPLSALGPHPAIKVMTLIDKFKINNFYGGGSILMDMCFLEKVPEGLDLSSLTTIAPMGTSIRMDTLDLLQRHFSNLKAVPNFYVTTECGGFLSFSETQGKLGYVAPGTILKIVDSDTNEVCGPKQVGEICFKTALMTSGYFNRPEEDAKLFTEDGFMRTGDLGHYDEDLVLYFDGRSKELIKYKKCIHPGEIESVILKHPDVKEVAVFGRQDPVLIEAITAAVVKKEGSSLTEDELIKMVEEEVEDCMRLRGGAIFIKELPRNAAGKVVRRKLQQLFE